MSNHIRNEERDKVLLAFHQASDRPTAEFILEWIGRYPEFAEDIRAHAAVSLEWAAREGDPALEPSQSLFDRNYSNALNALYNARATSTQVTSSPAQSLHDIAAMRRKEIHVIAREIDIARGVLADLFNGWMRAPIRGRLVNAVCTVLLITPDIFYSALTVALQNPHVGHAKATGARVIAAKDCDASIRDSNMTDERKRYWLEED